MKETRLIMGMPVIVEIVDADVKARDFQKVFDYFGYVDEKFSTYKKNSEISKINRGEITKSKYSADMQQIFQLAQETKTTTGGYFDIFHNGSYDPSGIVKGWAIFNASKILKNDGFHDYYVEAGGDIQVAGTNSDGDRWAVGIKNPFNVGEIVKKVYLTTEGIATSGTYLRGQHIYNPKRPGAEIKSIRSLTVIGPNIYDADRFATAAFAMEGKGISLIESISGFEGYMIDTNGIATMTTNFEKYTK